MVNTNELIISLLYLFLRRGLGEVEDVVRFGIPLVREWKWIAVILDVTPR